MTGATKAALNVHESAWTKVGSAQLETEVIMHALEWLDGEVTGDRFDPDVLSVFIGGILAEARKAHDDLDGALNLLRTQ